ncbi:MAG: hypothetical protein WA129_13020 [Acidovorax sp.]
MSGMSAAPDEWQAAVQDGAASPPDRSTFMRLIGAAQVPAPPGKV